MNPDSDQLSIQTPELVDIEMPLAGIGSRFIAILVDTLIWAAALLILGLMFYAISPAVEAFSQISYQWQIALWFFAVFLLNWGYFTLFEAFWNGQTPGKRVAKIRVIQRSGRSIGFFESLARNLVRYVDQIPFFYAVGVIVMFITRQHQRLGDLAAGTLVVRERRAPLPAPPSANVPDFAVADRYAAWDVSAVTSFELVTVRRFLERRAQLDPAARGRLGWELAERLRPKVAGAPPSLHPEEFLEALAEAKAARG
jgi:uncharacterized RDD family membrane protein YckC